jgi:hypothetical protein
MPKSKDIFEHILNNFATLINEYGYIIMSRDITEYYVKICYENTKVNRQIIIINDTNDFGFSVFLYNIENKQKILCNLYINIRIEMEDEKCNFMKYIAKSFFNYKKEIINGDKWKIMDKPRIYVDFNEMLDGNIVLLSVKDLKMDSEGNIIKFHEGLPVYIYSDDFDENLNEDNLIANGFAIKYDLSKDKHWSHVKWCCKIDNIGIIHESDLKKI